MSRTLDWDRHLALGALALSRGYVDHATLSSILLEIRKHSADQADTPWRRILGEARFALVISELDGGGASSPKRETAAFGVVDAGGTAITGGGPKAHGTELTGGRTPAPPVAASVKDTVAVGDLGKRRTVPAPPLPPEEERYVAQRPLGSGGLGEVVEHLDVKLARRVAVKRLRSDLAREPIAADMLAREARIVGGLEHPNIVTVHDVGERPDHGPFYVMRLLDPLSLNDVLTMLRTDDESANAAFPLGRLLRQFLQVCDAIEYAHSRGVVHCDLKPANIVLGEFGEVVVVDWGLAKRLDEDYLLRGGTPGYAAPEQLDRSNRPIDRAVDVFALGVILYEIVTLTTAFPEADDDQARLEILNGTRTYSPPTPATATTHRTGIAPEIADICGRAMAFDPSARFATVRELAEAVEDFLEGTKERERRRRRADELAIEGDAFAESFRDFVGSRKERLTEVQELRRRIPPWAPIAEKRALWDAEDRVTVMDALTARALRSAISAYEQAILEVPEHYPARRGLSRLYRMEQERARERRDDFNVAYLGELIKEYDAGEISGDTRVGTLTIVLPPRASAALETLAVQDRRIIVGRSEPLDPLATNIRKLLPVGEYQLRVRTSSGAQIVFPATVSPGDEARITLDVKRFPDARPGEILVPSGPALVDLGEAAATRDVDVCEVDVPSFFIDALPVTFRQYLEFVRHLYETGAAGAQHHLPKSGEGALYFRWDGESFAPMRITEFGDDLAELLEMPVFGISAVSAAAYAAHLAETTGLPYRLPTEAEWQKAAGGIDGRRYPWGDHFDPVLCMMRDSRPGPHRPSRSGACDSDVSPYGVRDMAGGIADWVLPFGASTMQGPESMRPDRVTWAASRGGAWCDWESDCSIRSRRRYLVHERSPRVGFRLARTVEGAQSNARVVSHAREVQRERPIEPPSSSVDLMPKGGGRR